MAAEHLRGVQVFTVLLLSIAGLRLRAVEGCAENERRALLAIKSDMYDPGGWFSSWIGRDCCKWSGVVCDNATGGHVTKLDLRYPFFHDDYYYNPGVSKVNPSLLELKHLKYLDLSMNNFNYSSIPTAIASLVHLEYLNLSNAQFGGPIPSQLGNLSSLSFLDLNGRYGNLTFLNLKTRYGMHSHDLDWLSRIPSLIYLDMSYVNLSRAMAWLHQINSIHTLQVLLLQSAKLPSIPSPLPLFNLTSISMLDLSNYDGFGDDSLLRWITNGTNLECLYLQSCCSNLSTETVQLAVSALGNLKELDLSHNNISGNISRILKNASSRLEHLDLDFNLLRGGVPQIFGNFRWLRYLSLHGNQIEEEISPNMGNLVHLEYLNLSNNKISSRIPWSMGNLTNLVYLDLSNNRISGGIPRSMGNLNNLQRLLLYNNSITGEIPQTLGNLNRMEVLDMSNNQLSGKLPRMAGPCNLNTLHLSHNNIGGELTDLLDGLFSNCPQGALLQSLELIGNKLSGMIPPSLGQFSQLRSLDLSSNSLQGNITEAHFSKLANLNTLNISHNFLSVLLPNDWHPPFSASVIDMSYCRIRGKIFDWIQTQSRLSELHLSGAELSGELPAWFSNFILESYLRELDLSSNNLSGLLPFTTTFSMDLSNNLFFGPIPSSFFNSTNYVASLSYNRITGSIPSSFCNNTFLVVLDLSKNRLSGEIPNCQGSFPVALKSLHLNDNDLSGSIPSFLAHCTYLMILDIGENNLFGEIPTWLGRNLPDLKVLRLRSNILHGVVPANLANLTSIQVLDLSFNKLHGVVPSSFGSISSMIKIQNDATFNDGYKESIAITAKGSTNEYTTELISLVTSIDLSNNILSGSIPEELTNLLRLDFLSLSNNHLTGEIPKNIGAMKQLLSLDLSANNLTGAIPPSLADLNQLEHLNLSCNNLSGRIPKGNQLQTFADPSLFTGNRDLCGFPLPECPSDTASSQAGDEDGGGKKLDVISKYTFITLGFVVGFWVSISTLILKQSIRFALFRSIDELYDKIYVQLAIRYFAKHAQAQK